MWGGHSSYDIPVPETPELWGFCDNYGIGEAAWNKVNIKKGSPEDLEQQPYVSYAASASTKDAGFVFGGREYRSTPIDGTESSTYYLTFNFTNFAL